MEKITDLLWFVAIFLAVAYYGAGKNFSGIFIYFASIILYWHNLLFQKY